MSTTHETPVPLPAVPGSPKGHASAGPTAVDLAWAETQRAPRIRGRGEAIAALWRRATRRHVVLRQKRVWRIGVISLIGALTAVPIIGIPMFAAHPFLLLYVYVVFAAWYGTVRESGGAVLIGVAAVSVLLPTLASLPVEAVIFTLASLMLIVLVQSLRRARSMAQDAHRRTEEALRAAVEAVRVRDDVLTTVSHDLKNPLAAIKGQAQVLSRRAARAGTGDVRGMVEGLDSIDISTSKMARLLDELLDAAQVQTGQLLALHPQPVELVGLLEEIVRQYQAGTEMHRLRLEVEGPPLVGVWDMARLERVFGNLLSNALKYSPAGGEIQVSARREAAGWVVVEVRDHGIGIPLETLPRVFERFVRADNVGRTSGTGVGLAVVRQIVELHGGTIRVRSKEGVGTTFSVRLPLASGDHAGGRKDASEVTGTIVALS